jgi:hypothetical protein
LRSSHKSRIRISSSHRRPSPWLPPTKDEDTRDTPAAPVTSKKARKKKKRKKKQ